MGRLVVNVGQLAELIEQALRRYDLGPDVRVGSLLNQLMEVQVLMNMQAEARRMGVYLPPDSFTFEVIQEDEAAPA